MKSIFLLSYFILTLNQPEPELKKAVMQAAGLTCAMCSNAIYKSLLTLPFVDSVEPDLSSSSFVISFKKNTNVDPDAIRRKVEDAGFSIASFSWGIVFNNHDIPSQTIFTARNIQFCIPYDKKLNGEQRLIMTDINFTSARNRKIYERQWKSKQCKALNNVRVYQVVLPD